MTLTIILAKQNPNDKTLTAVVTKEGKTCRPLTTKTNRNGNDAPEKIQTFLQSCGITRATIVDTDDPTLFIAVIRQGEFKKSGWRAKEQCFNKFLEYLHHNKHFWPGIDGITHLAQAKLRITDPGKARQLNQEEDEEAAA